MLLRGARAIRNGALLRRLHVTAQAARTRAHAGRPASVTAATGRPDTGDMYADAAAAAEKEMLHRSRGHARAARAPNASGAGRQLSSAAGGRDEQFLSEDVDASSDGGAVTAGNVNLGGDAALRLSDDEFIKVACDLLDDVCDGVLEAQAGAGGFRVAVTDGELRVEMVAPSGSKVSEADAARLASGDASPEADGATAAASAGDGSVLTLRPDVDRQVVAMVLPSGQELHYYFDAVARDWMPAGARGGASGAGVRGDAVGQAPPLVPELLRQFRLLSEVKPLF